MVAYLTKDNIQVEVTAVSPGPVKKLPGATQNLLSLVGLASQPTVVDPIYLIQFPNGSVKVAHNRIFPSQFTRVG